MRLLKLFENYESIFENCDRYSNTCVSNAFARDVSIKLKWKKLLNIRIGVRTFTIVKSLKYVLIRLTKMFRDILNRYFVPRRRVLYDKSVVSNSIILLKY